jgi:hypothetical protein
VEDKTMPEELIPSGGSPAEWEALAKTIGAVINPLAQQQADVQKRAIDANLERERLAMETRRDDSKRFFYLSAGALVVIAVVSGGLLFAGQYQLAMSALSFIAGVAAGYGVGRTRQSVQ